jgi:two-component system cell cycle sensor histidine kinase/response regulator CckA
LSSTAKISGRLPRPITLGRALGDGELRFRAMFDGAAIGIAICTLDGHILESNPALTRMLGYSREECVGMHGSQFHPGDFQRDEVLLGELIRGERESFQLEKRYRRKDGAHVWGNLTVSMVRDASSHPAFLIAMVEDTTERKRVAEQLREAEKMEVIGRVAGGIAHDFNNLLTGILLYCDLLSSGLDPASQFRQHVEEIRMAGEQGAALTQQLLAIARKQTPQPRPVQLNDIVSSTENLLRRLIGEQIDLKSVLGHDLGTVRADPAQLRQILLNLVLNGRDAMPQGGSITVHTRRKKMQRGSEHVSLTVEDTGCGMSEEIRARLFEPFFTTKKPGHGTGLGLATVQRIVGECGGTIRVESEPGRGTRVEVSLPATKPSRIVVPPGAKPRSSATILLVDDHASTRNSLQRVLRNAGYRVLPASTGKRAMKLFSDHAAEIDLLIADEMMPGLSGQELAHELCSQKPELRVMLTSGYQHAPSTDRVFALIRKPFDSRSIVERISEVLDSRGGTSC